MKASDALKHKFLTQIEEWVTDSLNYIYLYEKSIIISLFHLWTTSCFA